MNSTLWISLLNSSYNNITNSQINSEIRKRDGDVIRVTKTRRPESKASLSLFLSFFYIRIDSPQSRSIRPWFGTHLRARSFSL